MELDKKALDAAETAYGNALPQGYDLYFPVVTVAIQAYLDALPYDPFRNASPDLQAAVMRMTEIVGKLHQTVDGVKDALSFETVALVAKMQTEGTT